MVLGYDVAGIVERVGSEVSLFKGGERVYAAERIVGLAPESISPTVASAQSLVLLTAWEGLFEGLGLSAFDPSLAGKRLLMLPAGGAVGSYVVQLASKLLGLEVIAVASARDMERLMNFGARHVISYKEPLKTQLE